MIIRRDPKAIIAQFIMDPIRREVYVEGYEDAIFLRWLSQNEIHPDARILEISSVEIPGIKEGGNRGRALAFAKEVECININLYIFIDADFDNIIGQTNPAKIILTDGRDIEGYLLREECIDTALKLGLKIADLSAREILDIIIKIGRELGYLRLLSKMESIDLPFQRTDLWNYLLFQNDNYGIKLREYCQALIQNHIEKMSLKIIDELILELVKIKTAYSYLTDLELIHGKDALCIFEKLTISRKIKRGEGRRVLWASFRKEFIADYTNLYKIYNFIIKANNEN
jgi:hypothetical protein